MPENKQETSNLVFTIKNLSSSESAKYIHAIFEAIRVLEEKTTEAKNVTYSYDSTPKSPVYRGPG